MLHQPARNESSAALLDGQLVESVKNVKYLVTVLDYQLSFSKMSLNMTLENSVALASVRKPKNKCTNL